ncbi:Erg28-domain-containing protein [Thelephora ganbajun]|uniref:Erg28-domain-containing protein n=1 Tax=Thelephora ganbajun TaxID=370292 RepID=A0ACB6ZJV7_THEGA|nr:Erg28-domain-containing protein [Thelephora ganbajun]
MSLLETGELASVPRGSLLSRRETVTSYLPQAGGLLPKWQLIVAFMAFFNAAQNFATLKLTRRIYGNVAPQLVTGLQARTFAVWTILSGVVRLYAAYNINLKIIYDLTLFTYLFAFAHFGSELLIFRTASLGLGALSPVVVSTVSLTWMIMQYDFYVQ